MYKALYRRWRPLTFDDVVSQPHITTTLKNQIINDKTAHAYLFTGSRGTGKTTCARIFAKAINCLDSKDGEPCLKCEICHDADIGALADIIEIDAASNNGVDDIRDIRDAAIYTPERCKYRVYIIDEVHMLSVNAFNALLKIMEEPPPYIKFILATTEVHKVPATILSRCQRYDFRRILASDIVDRLIYISDKEGIQLDNDAAALIAKIADGGMRDALSLLDQCIAYSDNVTLESVSSAAGIAGRDYLFSILENIIDQNSAECINITDKLYSMSKDMQRLCEELLSQMRNLMLIKTAPQQSNLLTCLPSEIDRLKNIAQKISLEIILDKLNILQETNERLSRVSNKRIELEMCMVKLCTAKNKNSTTAVSDSQTGVLLAKIEELENRLAQSSTQTKKARTSSASMQDTTSNNINNESSDEPTVDMSKINPSMLKPLESWPEILEDFNKVNPAVSGSLQGSMAFVYQNLMLLIVQNQFFLNLFKQKENALSLGNVVKAHLGKSFVIKAKCTASNLDTNDDSPVNRLISKAKNENVQVEIND